MDALAGYGSDSDSDDGSKPGGLSGLLAHYSDDSDSNGNANSGATNIQNRSNNGEKPEGASITNGKDCGKGADVEEEKLDSGTNGAGPGEHVKRKRRRRWDNPNDDSTGSVDVDGVLPPPPLLTAPADRDANDGQKGGDDPFQSLLLFRKDYTKELRQKLSRQLLDQSRGKGMSNERQRLNEKLQRLHDKFQGENRDASAGGDAPSAPRSFAAHLKSQKEFGNPGLLGGVIEHYSLNPLGSHVGNSFSPFERADRLASAEERARIARARGAAGAANCGPGSGA